MDYQTTLARQLLQIKAIKLSPQKPFTWASGLRSPIYCDNRIALSHPEVRRLIRDGFAMYCDRIEGIDGIAGVATAGIAHGALLAERLALPFIYVRAKAKEHGRQNRIEGQLHAGARYVVVEDLISTGGSSLSAVRALEEAGGKVVAALAIFTYGFTQSTAAFAAADCPLQTLTDYDTLIQVAQANGYIDPAERDLLQTWRQDPKGWSAAQLTT